MANKIGKTAEGFWIIEGWGVAFTTKAKAEKYKRLKIRKDRIVKNLEVINKQMSSLSI